MQHPDPSSLGHPPGATGGFARPVTLHLLLPSRLPWQRTFGVGFFFFCFLYFSPFPVLVSTLVLTSGLVRGRTHTIPGGASPQGGSRCLPDRIKADPSESRFLGRGRDPSLHMPVVLTRIVLHAGTFYLVLSFLSSPVDLNPLKCAPAAWPARVAPVGAGPARNF